MEDGETGAWLSASDPPPVIAVNLRGAAPFLLTGDHAGRLVPAALGTLGIAQAELARHIGWDIGIAALGEALAARLDAPFLRQAYSRLVIDCNRDPAAHDAIPPVSDGTPIPANAALDAAARAARVAAIHAPYQAAIGAALAARGERAILIALHSFTPKLATAAGPARPWHVGILHDGRDERFAIALLAALRARGDLVVGDNEPYRMDGIDHSVPRHAFDPPRPYAEIEVRQDLIGDGEGVSRWAAILGEALERAAAIL